MAAILPLHQTTVVNLYTALFNRAPDASGLAFWAQAYADGAALGGITQLFLSSPEGRQTYAASQSSTQFVAAFYQTVFGRAPDDGGLAFWTAVLVNAGGAGSDAARAELVAQIVGTVSVPLPTKPDGLSDAQYAQTVADRALFGNKVQVGTYFAVTLKGTDVALAKQTLALVTADATSVSTATAFADRGGVPVVPPVPTLSITQADAVADITAKFTAYPATIATVDAAGMSGAQLAAVAAAAAKIAAAGISNLALVLNDANIVGTATADLLSKAKDATVVATGGTTAEIAALVAAIGSVAAGGISGALPLDASVAVTDLTALMAKYVGTTATVNAAGMTTAQLVAIADASAKVGAGGISDMALALGAVAVTDAIAQVLLAKAVAATVDTTNATAVEIAALVTAIGNIAPGGITGALALNSATAGADIAALFGKYAGTTAVVNAGTMDLAQLLAVAGGAAKISTGALTNLSLALGNAAVTDSVTAALLAKATGATVDATGATSAEIATVMAALANIADGGLTGALPIDSTVAAADIATLFTKYAGATALVNATGMNAAQLLAVAGGAGKMAAAGITGMTLALGDPLITDAATASLLGKATAASVDVTNASTAELATLTASLANIGAGGISGALAVSKAMTATEIAALMAKYVGTSATVDATDMQVTQLTATAAASTKLAAGGVTNLSLVLNDPLVTDGVTTALLQKASAARVDASGASTIEVGVLVGALGNIAAGGIGGALPIGSGVGATDIAALLAKYVGTTAAVNAAGMSSAQLVAVAGADAKIGSIASPTLVLGDALLSDTVTAATLAKASAAAVEASGATSVEVASLVGALSNGAVAGIVGALPVTSAVAAGDITALMATYLGTTAVANATAMTSQQLVSIATAGAKFTAGGVTGLSLVLNDAAIVDSVTAALLTKASGATVDVTGATATEITSLLGNIGNIAANGITGTLVLDSSTDAAGIAALMGKYAGSSATVNATGMAAAQLSALSQSAGKLAAGGISNLSLALGDASITDAATTALLGKATNATVDASGASANEVSTLVASLANVAANGITGALSVSSGVSASNLPTLFGKYNGTTATVNASGMSEAQLLAIAGVNGKLVAGGITGLSLVLGNANITDAVTSALVGKASGASINATGASNAELVTMAASVGNIAANGITGNLVLSFAALATPADRIALLAKYSGATATIQALDMTPAQNKALVAEASKIAANGLTYLAVGPADTTLTDADYAVLLSKSTESIFTGGGDSVARLQLVADNIARFFQNGILGTLNLNSQFSATQLAAFMGPQVQAGATVNVDAAGMTTGQLAALVLASNPQKFDSLINVQALALSDPLMNSFVAGTLLVKGTGATVVATGASVDNIDLVFSNLGRIADQGISGVLPLTAARFNATSAGALDPKLAASASVAVTGSASDETFDIRSYTHAVTIAAGDGRDTLIVSGTSLLGAGAASTAFTGMDVLQLKGTATAYMSKVVGVTELSIDPATGPIEVREITAAQAQNLKILNGPGASIALYLDGAATSTTDIVKATVSTTNPGGGGQPVDLTGITLPDVEALELTSNGNVARGVLTLTTANARALTSIKVVNNGDSFITVDAAHTGSGLVIDGRGSARTVIDASAYAPASGVTIYGGASNTSNPSKLNGSAGADVIVGGAGDDIIAGDGAYRGYAGLGEMQTIEFSGDAGPNGGVYRLGGYSLNVQPGQTSASIAQLLNANPANIAQVLSYNASMANAVFSATQVVVTFTVSGGDVAPLTSSYVNKRSDGSEDTSITPTLTAGPSVQTRAYDPAVSFAAPAAVASADTLTGGAGKNTFAFAQNSSTVTAYDTITDLKLGGQFNDYIDTLIFVNPNGTRVASILSGQAQIDVMAAGSLAAAVTLALSSAASDGYTLQFTYGTDTWLLHNGDGNAVFNNGTDYLLKITGVTGTLDHLDVVLG